jgi:hypothetical protein
MDWLTRLFRANKFDLRMSGMSLMGMLGNKSPVSG